MISNARLLPTTIAIGLAIASLHALGSSSLVGTDAIQHCGTEGGLSISCHDDEAIQLRFANARKQSLLQIDFVLRGKNVPSQPRLVEVFLTSPQRSGGESAHIAFQADRQRYPLAVNVDSHGVAKSVLPLEQFVRLVLMSTLEGTAFGEHFVASDQQMLALRLVVGRWVAQDARPK